MCTEMEMHSGMMVAKRDDLLPDNVVAPGVVVGRVLLTRHHLLGVEELPVNRKLKTMFST